MVSFCVGGGGQKRPKNCERTIWTVLCTSLVSDIPCNRHPVARILRGVYLRPEMCKQHSLDRFKGIDSDIVFVSD